MKDEEQKEPEEQNREETISSTWGEPAPDGEKPHQTSDAGSGVSPDGSYEISFGAGESHYSAGDGYNAYGFNANGSGSYRPAGGPASSQAAPPTQTPAPTHKRRNIVIPIMTALSAVFLVLSIVFSLRAASLLEDAQNAAGNYLIKNPGVAGSPTQIDNPTTLWVNPEALDSDDIYANATAKTVNSVVVITANLPNGVSSGAGVIWSSGETDSYIITCAHVVENAQTIQITFYNNESCHADLVGSDARTDIALLHIGQGNLPSAVLPNDDYELKLGQSVIVIGNPLGTLGNTVSSGILSSLSRTVTVENTTMELMQTNAAINNGNSGGGMFDMNGQLIGLVNAKVGGESIDNIGFAIPYTTLKTIAAEILEKGYVSGRPRFGITTVSITDRSSYEAAVQAYPDLAGYATSRTFFGSQIITGVYVVDASGVAGYAEGSTELAFGDRIVRVGNQTINSASDLVASLNSYNAGDTVQITVTRKNDSYVYVVELILSAIDD